MPESPQSAAGDVVTDPDTTDDGGGFLSSATSPLPPAANPVTGSTDAASSSLRKCVGDFLDKARVANVYFRRGKYGTLYWDFYLTKIAIGALGPTVTTSMPYSDVNSKPINPPYSPHTRASTYDFHSSLYRYQGLSGNPSGTLQTGDRVRFVWLILSDDGSGEGAYRYIT